MGNFVHLHLHTEYSLLDGAARYKQVVKKCKALNMPAVAITDHGNMYGVMLFYNECVSNGIKPIIGCEFYLCHDLHVKTGKMDYNHLIILAKNEIGYKNICKLNSIAFIDGFYYKPRIDYETLKAHSEGLIVLSACLRGDIPQYILHGLDADAERQAKWYKDIFGDDFYLELQNHYLEEDKVVNPKLKEIGRKLGIKTVVTNDVHYINREDSELQDVLSCVSMNKRIDDPDRLKMPNDEFYLKTYDEMLAMFPNDEESLQTTLEIADKCDVKFEFGHYHFPKYQLPEGETSPIDYLWKLVNRGIEVKLGGDRSKEVMDRINDEMSLIISQGFVEYFLTVYDYINFARNHDIDVGPGRGSGAGSFVAYLIGITDVNSIKYDLFFERFINKERVTAPDFDIDFQDDRRDEVYNYVVQKYGEDRVVKIITFGTMAAKNAIKDVGRVLRVPYSVTDKITKLMPAPKNHDTTMIQRIFNLKGDSNEVIEDLVALYKESDEVKKVVDIAAKVEGMPKNTSIHPCGVLIGFDTLQEYIPLARNGDDITTQYENKWLEKLGHLKFDFLGLRNLTDIKYTKRYIKENYDVDISFAQSNYDDPDTYKMLSSGDTKAVFQLESGGMVRFMRDLKPSTLEDIIAGVALYRPGPMDEIPNYVHNKHNPDDIKYIHPLIKPIVSYTYGVIVYQEQVMQILQVLAGYTLGQADIVRRMMSKKEIENMAKERLVFLHGKPAENGKPAISGVLAKGLSEDEANNLWNAIEKFASYAFNKSHATVYAYIAYQTAYLKCHYEKEYLTAVLNNRITKADEITNYISYAKSKGIEVLPPNINESETYFTCHGKENKIRFGLAALKNVGVNVIESVVKERVRGGKYKDLYDFVNRQDSAALNKRCIESMILSGAFDCFGKHRSQLMRVYPTIIERVLADKSSRAIGQYSLFDTILANDNTNDIEYPDIPEYSHEAKLKLEKDMVGIYISGHPLDKFKSKLDTFDTTSEDLAMPEVSDDDPDSEVEFTSTVGGIKEGDRVTCGGIITDYKRHMNKAGREMAFARLEDMQGSFDIVFFPAVFSKFRDMIHNDNLVTISGRVNLRQEGVSLVVDNIEEWDRESESSSEGETYAREKTLYLLYDMTDIHLHESIVKSLKSYPGTTPVIAKCSVTGKAYQIGCNVNVDSFLMSELHAFLPDHHIKIV